MEKYINIILKGGKQSKKLHISWDLKHFEEHLCLLCIQSLNKNMQARVDQLFGCLLS